MTFNTLYIDVFDFDILYYCEIYSMHLDRCYYMIGSDNDMLRYSRC